MKGEEQCDDLKEIKKDNLEAETKQKSRLKKDTSQTK
jgi:hypothetical protein